MSATVNEDSPMSASEFRRLEQLEKSVKGNWRNLGRDLKEIKDSKLYRQTSDGKRQSWEQYCKDHQGFSKQYVDKVIRAYGVIGILETETNVSVLPKSVSQAAQLSGLTPEQMEVACEKACTMAEAESREVIENDYREAVRSLNEIPSSDLQTTNVSEEQGDRSLPPENAEIDSNHITTPEESQPDTMLSQTQPRKPGKKCSIDIHVENDGLAELLKERLRTSGAATTLGEPKGHFVSGFTSRDQIANYLKAIQRLLKEGKQLDIQITIK